MRSEGIAHIPVAKHDQLFLVDAGDGATDALLARSAYAMEGGRLLAQSSASVDDFRRSCDGIDWGFIKGRTFGAKAKRVRGTGSRSTRRSSRRSSGGAATRESTRR
jgi:hypothetical protein